MRLLLHAECTVTMTTQLLSDQILNRPDLLDQVKGVSEFLFENFEHNGHSFRMQEGWGCQAYFDIRELSEYSFSGVYPVYACLSLYSRFSMLYFQFVF